MSEFIETESSQVLRREIVALLSELDVLRAENTACKSLIRSVLNDLPASRDWLNPDLEKQMQALTAPVPERTALTLAAMQEALAPPEPQVYPSTEDCVKFIAAWIGVPTGAVAAALLGQAKSLNIDAQELIHQHYRITAKMSAKPDKA